MDEDTDEGNEIDMFIKTPERSGNAQRKAEDKEL